MSSAAFYLIVFGQSLISTLFLFQRSIRSFCLIKTFFLLYFLTTGAGMFKDCGVELTKAELSGNPALGLKPSHLSAEAESRR